MVCCLRLYHAKHYCKMRFPHMLLLLSIIGLLIGIGLLLVAFKPEWSGHLLWITFLAYPQGFWRNLGAMPLNIGLDDLLTILLAINVMRLPKPAYIDGRFPWATKLLIAYLVIVAFGGFNGYMLYYTEFSPAWRGFLAELNLKSVLKMGVFLLFLHTQFRCIQGKRTWKHAFAGWVFASLLGALIILIGRYNFAFQAIFSSQQETFAEGWAPSRISGAYGNANVAGGLLALSVAGALYLLAEERVLWKQLYYTATICVMSLAILITGSRTGALCMIVVVIASFGVKRVRLVSALVTTVGVFVLIWKFQDLIQSMEHRLMYSFSTDGSSETRGMSIGARIKWWVTYLNSISLASLFLGRGPFPQQFLLGQKAHNGIIDLISWYGISGVAWLGFWCVGILRRTHDIVKYSVGFDFHIFGKMMVIWLVCFWLFAMTTDPFTPGSITLLTLFSFLGYGEVAHKLSLSEYDLAYYTDKQAIPLETATA